MGRVFDAGERTIFKELALDYYKNRSAALEKEAKEMTFKGLQGKIIDLENNKITARSESIPVVKPVEINPAIQKRMLGNFNAKQSERNQLIEESKENKSDNTPSTSKFTFKRTNDSSDSSTPQSSKKAKFRQDNPIESLSPAGVNRNKLALCDSNTDFDSSPKKVSNRKGTVATKVLKDSPANQKTVGVWIQNHKKFNSPNPTTPKSNPPTTKKTGHNSPKPISKPFSFSNLNIDLDDDLEDIIAVKVVQGTPKSKDKRQSLNNQLQKFNTVLPTGEWVSKNNSNTDVINVENSSGHKLGERPKNKFNFKRI